MNTIIFVIIAYLIGSIPTGVWIGKKFKNIDIREHGSKNTGTTNAYRVLGARYGIMVLLLDILKGFLPVYAASSNGITGVHLIVVGVVAIIGHSLSIFLNFKGGKGVATSLGVFLFLIPKIMLILIVVFILVSGISKYISLASIICATLLPILTYFLPIRANIPKIPLVIINFLIGSFVVYRHRDNIQRILNGKENKFKF
ncbi:glycerol-3-phosphate 1-O-acyltransferase PlsY [Fusobacterium sp. PH5-44]|uniref:glycerol-3-phosphate 1-O-acyltransferase PlsY n=1 Tax=unclassified Fusobacterium TaxID=2648384 RepID=UPI003D1E47EF